MGRTDERRAASQFYYAPEISAAPLTAAELHARFAADATPPGREGEKYLEPAQPPLDRPEPQPDVQISAEEAKQMEREQQFGSAAFDTTEPDAQLRDAWRQTEFSKQTIEADPWTAVYLAIPEKAEPWLLLQAQGVAHQCEQMISRGPGNGPRLQQGNDGPNENLQRAGRRAIELEERIQEFLGQEMPRPTRPEISDTLTQAVTEPFGLGERVALRAAEQVGDRLGEGIKALSDSIAPPPPLTQEQAELAVRAAQEAAEAWRRAAPDLEWNDSRGKEIDEAVRQQQNWEAEHYSRRAEWRPVDQPQERERDEEGREHERDRD